MIDHVVDASALALALLGRGPDGDALRARMPGMRRHAPHLIDAELGNVLRRHERARLISGDDADTARRVGRVLIDRRYPHIGALGDLAWSHRHNLTFYDALYVALATRLGVPLLTCDVKLRNAPGVTCAVEVV